MKLLIIQACLVNYGDDRGGIHAEVCEMPDVPKSEALALVSAGRALYVDRKDDHVRGGLNTATEAMLKAAAEALKPTPALTDPADPDPAKKKPAA